VLTGLESLDVPAGTTRAFELAAGLGGEPTAVRLASDRPITASVISDSGEGAKGVDFAVQPATEPIGDMSIWPAPVPKAARVTVMLTNAGEAEVATTVSLSNAIGAELKSYQVPLPPGLTALIDLPATELPVLRIERAGGDVRVGVIATQTLGTIAGLGSLAVAPLQAQAGSAEPSFDPLTGS
ncbi:MAG: hypothetical protein WAS07_01530, partial [Micropruina sp.]